MAKSYNKRVLYVNPAAGNCNWDIDWFRNHSMNAALLPPILDGNFVYSGLVPSNGGGLLVDLTSGSAKVDGTKFTLAAQSATVVGASLEAEEINFIYVDNTGTIVVTQIEPQVTCALIAIVDTDTTSVLRITDGRKMQVAHDTYYEKENDCINGNMWHWQRNTGQSAAGYDSIDRFRFFTSGSTFVVSRQDFTTGQTDIPKNPKYFLRDIVTSANTAACYSGVAYKLLDVFKYSGKKVCVKFHAKCSVANDVAIEGGQNFGSGGSTEVQEIDVQKVSLTTSWQKFVVFIDFPSISGKTVGTLSYSYLQFWFDGSADVNSRTDSLGNQSGTFEIAEIEIYESEQGIELPIRRRTEPEELALCQQYYWNISQRQYMVPISSDSTIRNMFLVFPATMIYTPGTGFNYTISGGGSLADYNLSRTYFQYRRTGVATGGWMYIHLLTCETEL